MPVVRDLGDGPPPPPPPPPTGDFPGDWRVWQRATSGPNRKPVKDANELRTAISNAQSGHQILLPAGGSIALNGEAVEAEGTRTIELEPGTHDVTLSVTVPQPEPPSVPGPPLDPPPVHTPADPPPLVTPHDPPVTTG